MCLLVQENEIRVLQEENAKLRARVLTLESLLKNGKEIETRNYPRLQQFNRLAADQLEYFGSKVSLKNNKEIKAFDLMYKYYQDGQNQFTVASIYFGLYPDKIESRKSNPKMSELFSNDHQIIKSGLLSKFPDREGYSLALDELN